MSGSFSSTIGCLAIKISLHPGFMQGISGVTASRIRRFVLLRTTALPIFLLTEKPIRDYLASVHDRFWLFHPERPFYQTEAAKIGTEYTASKLNGAVSESGNKIRLFCGCTGVQKSELSYSEAARWLLYVNNYDDTSSKPKGKNLPSPGAGWLGKLGLITIRGNNLFETLVYNLILLNHKRNFSEVWGPEYPAWEPDVPNTAERAEIPMPDNLSELYTLQSRRLWINRDDNEKVIGYNLLGGDFFEKVDAFLKRV